MIQLRSALFIFGFSTWESWSGFEVNLSWPGPNNKMKFEIETIKLLVCALLPKNKFVIVGPVVATGGVHVLYIWPKNDLYTKELFKKSGARMDSPKLSLKKWGKALLSRIFAKRDLDTRHKFVSNHKYSVKELEELQEHSKNDWVPIAERPGMLVHVGDLLEKQRRIKSMTYFQRLREQLKV